MAGRTAIGDPGEMVRQLVAEIFAAGRRQNFQEARTGFCWEKFISHLEEHRYSPTKQPSPYSPEGKISIPAGRAGGDYDRDQIL